MRLQVKELVEITQSWPGRSRRDRWSPSASSSGRRCSSTACTDPEISRARERTTAASISVKKKTILRWSGLVALTWTNLISGKDFSLIKTSIYKLSLLWAFLSKERWEKDFYNVSLIQLRPSSLSPGSCHLFPSELCFVVLKVRTAKKLKIHFDVVVKNLIWWTELSDKLVEGHFFDCHAARLFRGSLS